MPLVQSNRTLILKILNINIPKHLVLTFSYLHKSFIRNNENAVGYLQQIDPDGKCFFVAQTLRFVLEILRERLKKIFQNGRMYLLFPMFIRGLLIGNHCF